MAETGQNTQWRVNLDISRECRCFDVDVDVSRECRYFNENLDISRECRCFREKQVTGDIFKEKYIVLFVVCILFTEILWKKLSRYTSMEKNIGGKIKKEILHRF